jgi:hypothetical protein
LLKFIEISLNNKTNEFYRAKIETGKYFLTKFLSETTMIKNNIFSGGKIYNNFNDKYFETSFS